MHIKTKHKKRGAKKMSFEKEVIKQLLDEMFNKSKHFSICDVDTLGKMLNVNPSKSTHYKFLRALHCVNYSDMRPKIKNELQQRVAECLRPDLSVNVDSLAFILTAEGNSFSPIEDEIFPARLTKQ